MHTWAQGQPVSIVEMAAEVLSRALDGRLEKREDNSGSSLLTTPPVLRVRGPLGPSATPCTENIEYGNAQN